MEPRRPLIAGNWKMHSTLADAHVLARGVLHNAEHMDRVEIVLCPPAIWLAELAHEYVAPGALPHLKLGAQNIYPQDEGAFTGEISPRMVREVAEYCIVGHSERTHLFGETADLVHRKLLSALQHRLTPILCVGEDKQEATSKRQVVHQVNHLLAGLSQAEVENIVVAYEPVWAIGSGDPAEPAYVQDILEAIRAAVTPATRLLYGGSVAAETASHYLTLPDCDGLLVGGASLKLKDFITMCQHADDLGQPRLTKP